MVVIRPLSLAQPKQERKFLSGLVLMAPVPPFFGFGVGWKKINPPPHPNFHFGHTSKSKVKPKTQGF